MSKLFILICLLASLNCMANFSELPKDQLCIAINSGVRTDCLKIADTDLSIVCSAHQKGRLDHCSYIFDQSLKELCILSIKPDLLACETIDHPILKSGCESKNIKQTLCD